MYTDSLKHKQWPIPHGWLFMTTMGSIHVVPRPPSLFTSKRRPMHGTSCPKSQLKSTCLTAKFGSFFDHVEMGEKGQNVISSSVQHQISLIFAIHVSFIIPLPMMWILLTKPMQKSVPTVCLHCSFAKLKNKHIGVLGTNVATISWLHWSPVSGYKETLAYFWAIFMHSEVEN